MQRDLLLLQAEHPRVHQLLAVICASGRLAPGTEFLRFQFPLSGAGRSQFPEREKDPGPAQGRLKQTPLRGKHAFVDNTEVGWQRRERVQRILEIGADAAADHRPDNRKMTK